MKKRLLLVGLGRWGKILLKNIVAEPSAVLAGVVTSRPAEAISLIPKQCQIFPSLDEVFMSGLELDGVLLATPPESHAAQLRLLMRAGIPVFVEKPLTLELSEAEELLKLEKELGAHVLVDHVQIFHAGFERLWKECKAAKSLEIESEGGGPGPFRDYNALWDYGAHDLSMILDLMGEEPLEVKCLTTKQDGKGADFETTLRFRKGRAVFRSGTLFTEKKRWLRASWDGKQALVEDFPNARLRLGDQEIPLDHEARPVGRVLGVFLSGLEPGAVLDRRWGLELGVRVVRALHATGVKP